MSGFSVGGGVVIELGAQGPQGPQGPAASPAVPVTISPQAVVASPASINLANPNVADSILTNPAYTDQIYGVWNPPGGSGAWSGQIPGSLYSLAGTRRYGPLISGLTYTLSMPGAPGAFVFYFSGTPFLNFYNAAGVYQTSIVGPSFAVSTDARTVTFTVPTGGPYYLPTNLQDTSATPASPMTQAGLNAALSNIMMNSGSTALAFAPYPAPYAPSPALFALPTTGSTIVQLQTGYAHVRTVAQGSSTMDLVWRLQYGQTPVSGGSLARTGVVDFVGYRFIPHATTAVNTIAAYNTAPLVHAGGDEAAPVSINGMYLGANHGVVGCQITSTAHGRSNQDVGSIYSDGSTQWVLSSIIDANTLLIVALNAGTGTAWSFQTNPPAASPLTHISGGAHTGSLPYTGFVQTQLLPGLSGYVMQLVMDGAVIASTTYKTTSAANIGNTGNGTLTGLGATMPVLSGAFNVAFTGAGANFANPNVSDPLLTAPDHSDQTCRVWNNGGTLSAQSSSTLPGYGVLRSLPVVAGATYTLSISTAPAAFQLYLAGNTLTFANADHSFNSAVTTGFTLSGDGRTLTFTAPTGLVGGTGFIRINILLTTASAGNPMTTSQVTSCLNAVMLNIGPVAFAFVAWSGGGPTPGAAFNVFDPSGANVGSGIVGTPFNGGGLGFTVNAGSTSFIAGDGFSITTTQTVSGVDGVYSGNHFLINELYSILNPATQQSNLITNCGTATPSLIAGGAEQIRTCYQYAWNAWGALTISAAQNLIQGFARVAGAPGDFWGGLQVQRPTLSRDTPAGGATKALLYVPHIPLPVSGLNLQAGADITGNVLDFVVPTSACSNPSAPADHFAFFAYQGSTPLWGEVFGFLPGGRAGGVANVLHFSAADKAYPIAIDYSAGSGIGGTVLTTLAFRAPFLPTDPDLTIPAVLVTSGASTFCYIAAQKTLTAKAVSIPLTANLPVTVAGSDPNVMVDSVAIAGEIMMNVSNGYGDVVLQIGP